MRAGPKGEISAPPLDLKGWPADRAKRRIKFIEKYVIVPKGHGAGKPLKLRDFQREIVTGAYAAGVRTALVSIPRANAKTTLAAALAVADLFVGPPSAEVLVVASDQRQANIALRIAKRMIELNPELAERAQIYADRIVVPHNDAQMIALPADPAALHGWDPSLLVVDELHVVTEAVWEAVTSMTGKRPESLTLAISTPSTSPDCIMWRLVEHGRAGDARAGRRETQRRGSRAVEPGGSAALPCRPRQPAGVGGGEGEGPLLLVRPRTQQHGGGGSRSERPRRRRHVPCGAMTAAQEVGRRGGREVATGRRPLGQIAREVVRRGEGHDDGPDHRPRMVQ